jgi:isomerase DpgB
LVRRLERSNAISFAIARHVCSPLALELLLVADQRLANSDFLISRTKKMWPGMAIYRLSQQIGMIQARRLLLHGHDLNASTCLSLGLIDEILAGPMEDLGKLVEDVSRLEEFGMIRRLIQESHTEAYEEALGAHLAACDRILRKSSNTSELGHRSA